MTANPSRALAGIVNPDKALAFIGAGVSDSTGCSKWIWSYGCE